MATAVASDKLNLDIDPRHQNPMIVRLINMVMQRGKQNLARNIVYKALEISADRLKADPIDVLTQVVKNVSPILEVKSQRVGGATFQIPIEVRGTRQLTLAFRWLIAAAKARTGKPMAEKLADEFTDAYNNQGNAVRRREETHKMAEANRAFAHYARR